jgi:proline iminopeptidase
MTLDSPAARARSPAPDEGHIQVTGGRIWYRVVGSGQPTPLAVLDGGPGFSSHYLERLARLSDDRPVVFHDQLGAGRSERPDKIELWGAERFVEETERYVDVVRQFKRDVERRA